MVEIKTAEALVSVLQETRWVGVQLAKAYLALSNGENNETIIRKLFESDTMSLSKAKEVVSAMKSAGFLQFIQKRQKLGSAENPITKLFPAAITERRFLTEIDTLHEKRPTVTYDDDRFSGHTLVDFTLKEDEYSLPVNVKNAGTQFMNAQQLVGLAPTDCIPIPVYKAYDAIEKEPNLLYAISVDYSLLETLNKFLLPLFDEQEKITWGVLNSYTGKHIRDAEDKFVYGMTLKHWEQVSPRINNSQFRIISARKSIRIMQQQPRRTPGIGLRAWGTGASAEVNVHISISDETKSWDEIYQRVCDKGLSDIVSAINRKKTEVVHDPEI